MNQDQITKFKMSAQAQGYTPEQIDAFIKQKQTEQQVASGAVTPQAPETQDQGLIGKLGAGILNVGKSIAEPFIRTGKNILGAATTVPEYVAFKTAQLAGDTKRADEIAKAMVEKNPFISKKDFEKLDQNKRLAVGQQLADSLQIASYAIPFGKARAGAGLLERATTKAILPGAGVGVLASPETGKILKGQPYSPEKLVGEAALGAAIPTVIGGAGKLYGAITGRGGAALESVSEKAATKALRPSKTQVNSFLAKHGEDIGAFARDRNLVGKTADQISSDVITPLQDSFNAIARESGVKVTKQEVAKNFYDQIAPLLESGSTDDVKLAEKLLKEYDSVVNATGLNKGAVDIGKITNTKSTFDSKVKNWLGNPIEGGKNRLTANALRNTIQNAADKAGLVDAQGRSLKDIGLELSKLYSYEDIARIQAGLGKGNLPIGLTTLLGIGGGGIVAGIPGGVAVVAGKTLANNPTALGIFSRLSEAAGKAVSSLPEAPGIASGLKNIGTQAVVRATAGGGTSGTIEQNVPQKDNYQNNQGFNPQGNSSVAQTVTGYTVEQLGRAYTQALSAGDTASASVLKDMYDTEKAYQDSQVAGGTKLSAKDKALVNSGLSALNDVRTLLNNNPLLLVGQKFSPGKIGAREYDAAVYNMADAILRLRTGAQANPAEIKAYGQSIAPYFGDTKKDIAFKLQQLQNIFNFYLQQGNSATGVLDQSGAIIPTP